MVMETKRVEQLLHEYAQKRQAERLLSESGRGRLQAELAPPLSAGHSGQQREPARGRILFSTTVLAAAVVAFAAFSLPSAALHGLPGLVVDGAFSRVDLFRTTRGESVERGEFFYVGVKVDQPAYVRVVVLDDLGRLEPLALDRSGAFERQVAADTATVFGGYAVRATDDEGVESNVTALAVFAAASPMDENVVSGMISAWNRSPTELREPVARFVADARRELRCAVRSVRL